MRKAQDHDGILAGRRAPHWSVVIPAYNCAAFLHESLGGVIGQDPGAEAMDIVVVDDHSDDQCEEAVRSIAGERARYIRQPRRVGLVSNLNTALGHARGELVHILHADDAVLNGFYSAMGALLAREPSAGAAFCRVIHRDERSGSESLGPLLQTEAGLIRDALATVLVTGPPTSSVVVRRSVYEKVGGFDSRFLCSCEDWEMWVRIAANYPMSYEPAPLAKYRFMREGSLTAVNRDTGRYARDMALAHRIVDACAPAGYAHTLSAARASSADWILANIALPLSLEGKVWPAVHNAWHGIRCSPSRKSFHAGLQCLRNLVHPRDHGTTS
jgi:glycosyltransferase involved in cell wall biosynthesis